MKALLLGIMLAIALLFLVSCISTPINLPLNPSTDYESNPSLSLTRDYSCLVVVNSVEDRRFNKKNLGQAIRSAVFHKDLPGWIKQSFNSLNVNNIKVVFQKPQQPMRETYIILDVAIKKTYIHTITSSIVANVVLAISYDVVGTEHYKDQQIYRGQDTSVNWFNTDSEIHSALNTALNNTLLVIGNDIEKYCAS